MSFALFLLYVAFTFLRPVDLFAPGLAEYRPMLWLWLVAFLSASLTALLQRKIAATPVQLGLLAMLALAIAASQVANGWAGGAVEALSDFSTSALLLLLGCMNVTSERRLRATCAVIVACMVTLAAMCVAAYHDGYMVDQLVVRQGTGSDADLLSAGFSGIPAEDTSGTSLWRVRGLGILNDPNDLGQAIVMTLPLLFAGWRARRFLRNLLWVVAPGALLVYTIHLTHSRGALVGLGVLLLFALRNWLGTVRTVLAGLVGVVVLLGSGLGGGREFSAQEESAGQRVEAWYEGLQMLRENPVFGIGYGRFTDFHNLTAHNSFVLCFAETGLLGLFAWVGLLVVAWRDLAQVAALHPAGSEGRRRAEALRAALLGFLACAWFLSRTFQPLLYLLLALCFGAAWALRRGLAEAPGAATVSGPPWFARTIAATFGSVALVYLFVFAQRFVGD